MSSGNGPWRAGATWLLVLCALASTVRADDAGRFPALAFDEARSDDDGTYEAALTPASWSDELPRDVAAPLLDAVSRIARIRVTIDVTALSLPRVPPELRSLVDGDTALLDPDGAEALRRALRDGVADVVHSVHASGWTGERLTATELSSTPPTVERDIDTLVGMAMSAPFPSPLRHGLRVGVRTAPHAAGGHDVRYRLSWSDPSSLHETATPAGGVVGFDRRVRFAAGATRLMDGETALVRFVRSDGAADLVLLSLGAEGDDGERLPPLAAGWNVVAASHLVSDGAERLPTESLDDEHAHDVAARHAPSDVRREPYRDIDDRSADTVPGPLGLQFVDLGHDRDAGAARALTDALRAGAQLRGKRITVTADDGAHRITVPTTPGSVATAWDVVLTRACAGYDVQSACNDHVLLERYLETSTTGLSLVIRPRADGPLAVDLESIELLAADDVDWTGWTMVAGYRAVRPLDVSVRRTRSRRFVLRGAVAASGQHVASRVRVARSDAHERHRLVHTRRPAGDGVPVGGRARLDATTREDAVVVPALLCGRAIALEPGRPVRLDDHVVSTSIAGADADGFCGMVARSPELMTTRDGLSGTLTLRTTPTGPRLDVEVALRSDVPSPGASVSRLERVLAYTADDLPATAARTLAWSLDHRIDVEFPTLATPAIAATRVALRGVDGNDAGFVTFPGCTAVFEDRGVCRAPILLELYTSSHETADVRAELASVRDGVVVAAVPGDSGSTWFDVTWSSPPAFEPVDVEAEVRPRRRSPPERLVRLARATARRTYLVPDGRRLSVVGAPWSMDITTEPEEPR